MNRRDKGSWNGEPAVPVQPTTPIKMAAQYLRLVAGRFLKDNASKADVDEAVREWTMARERER